MADDLYSQLVNSPVGGFVARNVGLPQPVELDRYEPGRAPDRRRRAPRRRPRRPARRLDRPRARRADVSVKTELDDEVRAAAGEAGLDAGVWNPDAAGDARCKALVFDASGIADSARAARALGLLPPDDPRRRSLSGRVDRARHRRPSSCGSPREATAQRALEGFARAVGKEVRNGATAQLLYVAHRLRGRDRLDPSLLPLAALRLRLGPGRADRRAGRRDPRARLGHARSTARSRSSPAPRAASARRSPTCSRATAPTSSASTCPRSRTT